MSAIPDYLSFRKLVLLTVVAVYLLILVGGIVRSTGSGMGCPDWPKCFGRWIPPTEASQLPDDYKTHYAEKRKLKNERIASYLRMLNFDKLAVTISGDTSVYKELDFNALKTWIEYLNRLTGVLIGILIFAVFVSSFKFYYSDKLLFILSLASLLAVGIEGWLGSIVVSTNLLPFSVSVHMALALVLVGMLICLAVKADKTPHREIASQKLILATVLAFVCILLSFIQILLGTQVRESVDTVSEVFHHESRMLWIERLSDVFKVHRSFSILVFIANAACVITIYKNLLIKSKIYSSIVVLSILLVAEIVLGIYMAYFAIPAFSQPLHLLFGSLVLGVQMFLMFYLMDEGKKLNLNTFAV